MEPRKCRKPQQQRLRARRRPHTVASLPRSSRPDLVHLMRHHRRPYRRPRHPRRRRTQRPRQLPLTCGRWTAAPYWARGITRGAKWCCRIPLAPHIRTEAPEKPLVSTGAHRERASLIPSVVGSSPTRPTTCKNASTGPGRCVNRPAQRATGGASQCDAAKQIATRRTGRMSLLVFFDPSRPRSGRAQADRCRPTAAGCVSAGSCPMGEESAP